MTVEKLKHVGEAAAPMTPALRGDNLRQALELSAFCMRLAGMAPQRGLRRYRSIDEARADRERATARRETTEPPR